MHLSVLIGKNAHETRWLIRVEELYIYVDDVNKPMFVFQVTRCGVVVKAALPL
jgi:hypothetical protein